MKVCTTKHFIMVCLDRAHLCGKIATNLTLNGYAIYWVIEVGGAKCDVKDIHKFKTCVQLVHSTCAPFNFLTAFTLRKNLIEPDDVVVRLTINP